MKKISVIVPVYNVEKYLEKCIDSIIKQTYKNLEIILIDDGSTDNSGNICDEYAKKDDRIRVIHKENSGLSATRNLGVEICTGEYITFVDSDDYITEDYCEILLTTIEKENCDIASVDLMMVRDDGYKIVTSDDINVGNHDSKTKVFDKDSILKEVLLRKSFKNYICTKMYRRKVFETCQFKEGISYEDVLFTYETAQTVDKIAYVNKECYIYLKRRNSITATCSEKNLNDFLDVVIYRYEDIKKKNAAEEKYNIFALLESVISISIKYVIANKNYSSVEKKSNYIFDIIRNSLRNKDLELKLLPLLNDSQKVCLYLMIYNKDLFYNFLTTRQNMRKKGTFIEKEIYKSKICLLCDVKGWAFDMIAQIIKNNLSNKYEIEIDYFDMYKNPDDFYECLERNKDFDLIHVFWRKTLLLLESDEFKEKVSNNGKEYNQYLNEISNKISTCVYDYLYLEKDDIELFKNVFNKYSTNYYVSTKKLYNDYFNIMEYKKPLKLIHDICDWGSFVPKNLERFNKGNVEDRELVIGWVGNSKRQVNGIDLKGLDVIIKPVIQELKDDGYNIKEHYADRNERWRTVEEMPDYYSEIDICLCTSIHEGTPRPVLEAMSCGVPIISTNVGIVPEVFGKKQSTFNIGDRKNGENDEFVKKELKQKIVEIYNNRSLLKELSTENIESIKEYDGGKIIREFDNYFEQCLNSNNK